LNAVSQIFRKGTSKVANNTISSSLNPTQGTYPTAGANQPGTAGSLGANYSSLLSDLANGDAGVTDATSIVINRFRIVYLQLKETSK